MRRLLGRLAAGLVRFDERTNRNRAVAQRGNFERFTRMQAHEARLESLRDICRCRQPTADAEAAVAMNENGFVGHHRLLRLRESSMPRHGHRVIDADQAGQAFVL
jgi:aminoglycoside phosphotransferase family enzyme